MRPCVSETFAVKVVQNAVAGMVQHKTGTQWNLFKEALQTVKTNGDKECLQYRSPSDFLRFFQSNIGG